jgi:hypothetical protein
MTVIHPVVDRWLVLALIVQNIPRLDILFFVVVIIYYDFMTKIPDVVNGPQGFSIIMEIFEL